MGTDIGLEISDKTMLWHSSLDFHHNPEELEETNRIIKAHIWIWTVTEPGDEPKFRTVGKGLWKKQCSRMRNTTNDDDGKQRYSGHEEVRRSHQAIIFLL